MTSGAAIASTIRNRMNAAETIATRSERRRRQNSCRGERAAISPPRSRKSSCVPALSETSSASEPPIAIAVPDSPLRCEQTSPSRRIYTFDDLHRPPSTEVWTPVQSARCILRPMDTLFGENVNPADDEAASPAATDEAQPLAARA